MNRFSIKRAFLKTSLLCGLVILLTACTGGNGNNNNTNGNGNTPPSTQATQSATAGGAGGVTTTPGISLGPQPCPDTVKAPAHWDPLIPTQANVSKVESVTCGYLKGVPRLQALIMVRYDGTGGILDVYVYDDLDGATPTQIFKLQNLYKGDAKISNYNTLLTSEVDMDSSVNAGQANVGFTRDLAREFKWSDGANTLVQIAFPGMFPDITRYQAEADQEQVNQGHQPWKLSATLTAQALGANLLHWNPNAPASILSGGGQHDLQAVVSLKNNAPGSGTIKITMSRLEGNTNGGIWVVTDVSTDNMSITQPQSASTLNAPVTVTGTGNAFEGVIGTATILDHLYTDLGHASVHGAVGNGHTTFSTSVGYHPTFHNGAEEGLVMVAAENNASGGIGAAVIVKVLIH
ncbi:MAG TPA: hypothetical protein VFV38_12025 [Ktedonobacteraceae bacterium]|nr:hypothetical protein [Ktedonobacteraceae bacterium]